MSNLVTKSRLNYFANKLWNNKIKPIKNQLDSHTHTSFNNNISIVTSNPAIVLDGSGISGMGKYKIVNSTANNCMVVSYNDNHLYATHKNGDIIPIRNNDIGLGNGSFRYKDIWSYLINTESINIYNECNLHYIKTGNKDNCIRTSAHIAPRTGSLWMNLGTSSEQFGDIYSKGTLFITNANIYGTTTVNKIKSNNGQTIVMEGHVQVPSADSWFNLGQANVQWGDVYTKRGAVNGSDIRLKENIKDISEIKRSYNIDNDITVSDIYNYVKNTTVKSFNYKNTNEDILGIIANEIPDNIFNKIGIVNNDGIKMIFNTSQIALLQCALSESINRIELLTNEVEYLKNQLQGDVI